MGIKTKIFYTISLRGTKISQVQFHEILYIVVEIKVFVYFYTRQAKQRFVFLDVEFKQICKVLRFILKKLHIKIPPERVPKG